MKSEVTIWKFEKRKDYTSCTYWGIDRVADSNEFRSINPEASGGNSKDLMLPKFSDFELFLNFGFYRSGFFTKRTMALLPSVLSNLASYRFSPIMTTM